MKKVKVNEPKSIWLGGDKYCVTRTGEIPNALLSRVLSCQFRRFGRKLGRRPSVFSKYELPNEVLSIAVPIPQIQEQRVEVQRGNSQERLQQNPQERLQQHTVEYGVSNSSLEFEKLRKQAETAERMAKEAGRMHIKRSPISDRVQ